MGIDPSKQMLDVAKRESSALDILYDLGHAEALCLDNHSVSCIVAAQSIQWFDRPAFYSELKRVLEPHGLFFILQNNRNWRNSPFLEEYEKLLEEKNKAYNRDYREIPFQEEISKTKELKFILDLSYHSVRRMTKDEFQGMSYSSTKVNKIIASIGKSAFDELLEQLFNRHRSLDEHFDVSYETQLYGFCMH